MTVIHGDCIEVMAGMEPESVDAIVTDPPYLISFMGKGWDAPEKMSGHAQPNPDVVGFYQAIGTGGGAHDRGHDAWQPNRMQAWHARWAEAAYRVAKPSAYLLAFGGTRTVHRMTVALEDAGWIIRDMLVWAYASGFPKSKASLKPAWEPIVMARKPGPLRMLAIDECRIGLRDARPLNRNGSIGYGGSEPQGAVVDGGLGRWPANVILTDPIFDGGWDGVVGGGETAIAKSWGPRVKPVEATGYDLPPMGTEPHLYGDSGTYSRFFLIPRDSRSDALSGIIGTCQICGAPIAETPSTARTRRLDTAPLSAATPPSVSLAPDASDAASPSLSPATATAPSRAPTPRDGMPGSTASEADQATASGTNGITTSISPEPTPATAFPSDQPVRTAAQPTTSIATTTTTAAPWMCGRCADDATHGRTLPPPRLIGREPEPDTEASYSRFLIVPKAARTDREPVLGGLPERVSRVAVERHTGNPSAKSGQRVDLPRQNVHPTVKPTDLMRHLVRLVTPTGGTVLDPFLGSGTTALAAELEGFPWIGIEREAEYVAIAEARLNGTQRGLGLETA